MSRTQSQRAHQSARSATVSITRRARGSDRIESTIMGLGDGIHEAVPNTCFAPSDNAIGAGGAWAEVSGTS
jgi:hypothetical protein